MFNMIRYLVILIVQIIFLLFPLQKNQIYLCPIPVRGGTTAELTGRLHLCAFEQMILLHDTDSIILEEIMTSSRKSRHFQQKIAGIECTLLLIDSTQRKHFLIICKDRIIDLEDRIEYKVRDDSLKQKLNSVIIRIRQCYPPCWSTMGEQT